VGPPGKFKLLVLKILENTLVKTGIMPLVRVDMGMIRAVRTSPIIKAHKASMLDKISENETIGILITLSPSISSSIPYF
jgi:hypothetical protein